MKKRAISALMAATMVWAAISVPAFADNDTKSDFDEDVKENVNNVQGEHAAIGGVDTKEHKEHFRVAVPVEKNIYTFTVDPEKNGKITALVGGITLEDGTTPNPFAHTVYFDRHDQSWFGLPFVDDSVKTIGTGWQFSNKSDFMVVTNIGSVDVKVNANVDAIIPNKASKLSVGFEKYLYTKANPNWTVPTRPSNDDPLVTIEDVNYWPTVNDNLRREGNKATGETVDSTADYKFWHVVDETTYFNDALVTIGDQAGQVELNGTNLGEVNSVAFQVVAEATGKGWSENQQARIMMTWSVTSNDAILPHTLETKIKVDAENDLSWEEACPIPVNMGEGALKADYIANVYMVYGADNTEVDLGKSGDGWYSVKHSSDEKGADAELIISALAMQNIKAADEAEGGWIPVMFKIVYHLEDGSGTAESYVWLY